MRRATKYLLTIGAVALVAGAASAAYAQASGSASTPSGWNYEIKDGKRVPKSARTTNADGSTREEIRRGNCVTIKERSPDGTVKQTDRCD